jgi:hypothetical protein
MGLPALYRARWPPRQGRGRYDAAGRDSLDTRPDERVR